MILSVFHHIPLMSLVQQRPPSLFWRARIWFKVQMPCSSSSSFSLLCCGEFGWPLDLNMQQLIKYRFQASTTHFKITILKWKFCSLLINNGVLWCCTTPESALLQICQCSTFAGKFAFCHYCIGTRLLRQSASRLQPWVVLFSQTLSLWNRKKWGNWKFAVKTFLILQIVVKKLSSSLRIFVSKKFVKMVLEPIWTRRK